MSRVRVAGVAAATALALAAAPVAAAPSPDSACAAAVPEPTALVGVTPGRERVVAAYATAAGARVVGGLPALHVLEVAFASRAAATRVLPLLREAPGVRYAEEEQQYGVLDTPADPLFAKQWALRTVGAPAAWGIETGTSAPVTVAVLDTGVDFAHPDLAGALLSGFNVIAPGTPPQDDHTHGTHVAGIIAARTNNKVGVAGMSWAARILPVKPMDANGSGTTCDIVAGILYVASQAPDVLNMSIGGAGPCPAAMQEALDLAYAAGVLSVAAAGNSGAAFNLPNNPANCDHTLGVAATDAADRVADFSNYGPYVDVSAPGVDVLSTVIDPKKKTHGYAMLSGTSMAAPMVSGLAALLAAKHPDWTPDQLAARILSTSRDLGPRGWDEHYGRGRIDALRALR